MCFQQKEQAQNNWCNTYSYNSSVEYNLMRKRLVFKIIFILLILLLILIIYSKFFKEKNISNTMSNIEEETVTSSNIIKDVNYTSNDSKGNEYVINASEGQIDLNNTKTIFLTNVRAYIKLEDSTEIKIISDFGKYNIDNYDTIFSKNVIINYILNEIRSNYVDFSLNRNSMIISKDVVYTKNNNMLKADVIEIDIRTKDTKIFMHEKNDKVNIKAQK